MQRANVIHALKILVTSELLLPDENLEEYETTIVDKLRTFFTQKGVTDQKHICFYLRDRSVDNFLWKILKRNFPGIRLTEFVAEWHKYKEEAGIVRNQKLMEYNLSYVFIYLHQDNVIEKESGLDHLLYISKCKRIPIRFFKGVHDTITPSKNEVFVEIQERSKVPPKGSDRYNQFVERQRSNARIVISRMNRLNRSKLIFRDTTEEIMNYGRNDSIETNTTTSTTKSTSTAGSGAKRRESNTLANNANNNSLKNLFTTKIKRAKQQRVKRQSQQEKRKLAGKKTQEMMMTDKQLQATLTDFTQQFSTLRLSKEETTHEDSDDDDTSDLGA